MKYFVSHTEGSMLMTVKVCMSLSKAMVDLLVIWRVHSASRGRRWVIDWQEDLSESDYGLQNPRAGRCAGMETVLTERNRQICGRKTDVSWLWVK